MITSSTTSKHCLFPAPDISSASGVYLKCTKVTSETGLSCSAVCCSALSLLDVEQSCKQMAAGEIPIIKLEVTVQDLKEIFQVSFSSCLLFLCTCLVVFVVYLSLRLLTRVDKA